MNAIWKETIWRQFGAAIDMVETAISACPEPLWGDRSRQPEFWYLVFHTLFWVDIYLSGSAKGFAPPPPFTLAELDPAGVLPDRVYTKSELGEYLAHCRTKCRLTIASLTEAHAGARCGFEEGSVQGFSMLELLLYTMRHTQHHAAQLNLILRLTQDSAPPWVGATTIRLVKS